MIDSSGQQSRPNEDKMQCYGGPLDGWECPAGLVYQGIALLGLVRIRVGEDYPFWDAGPPTFKNQYHVIYEFKEGRLLFSHLKC